MATQLLYCPSANDFDSDIYFVVPDGMTVAEAKALAKKVYETYWQELDVAAEDAGRDDFLGQMKSAGFLVPEWETGPTWDEKPGTPKRRGPGRDV